MYIAWQGMWAGAIRSVARSRAGQSNIFEKSPRWPLEALQLYQTAKHAYWKPFPHGVAWCALQNLTSQTKRPVLEHLHALKAHKVLLILGVLLKEPSSTWHATSGGVFVVQQP